jgi:hypothetical protein
MVAVRSDSTRMSYRRRQTTRASLADTLSKNRSVAAVSSSIRLVDLDFIRMPSFRKAGNLVAMK